MKPGKILIVDDERHVTHVLALKLRQWGATVTAAHNGRDGLKLAREQTPDLVISDFQMPEMDGFQMALLLKQEPATAHVPVVILTARSHRLTPTDLARTNIQALMPKPFSVRELLATIVELPDPAPCADGDDPVNGPTSTGTATA